MQREKTRFKLEVARLSGLILTHEWDSKIPGQKDFDKRDRPNSTIVFWSFRIMTGLGMAMILLGIPGMALYRRGTLWHNRFFLRCAILMGPTGLIALLAGWYTIEIGRQPWTVYDVMRTADSVSHHSTHPLGLTLILFVVVYFAVFGVGIRYLMRLVRIGPKPHEGDEPSDGDPGRDHQPMRPLSAGADMLPGDLAPTHGS